MLPSITGGEVRAKVSLIAAGLSGLAAGPTTVESTAGGATVTLHLYHHEVEEQLVVGDETWQRLEIGIVARRDAQGALLGHFLDCRVTDIAADLRFCADGRVLAPAGEIGRLAPAPTLAMPFRGGWVAVVWTPEGLALQELGRAPVRFQLGQEDRPSAWIEYEGAIVAAWSQIVARIDPDTGEFEPLLAWAPIDVDELALVEGEVVARGRKPSSEVIRPQVYEIAVPRAYDLGAAQEPALTPIERPAPPRQPKQPEELTGMYREVKSTRWGLFASGSYAWGAEILGADGWRDLDERAEWEVSSDGQIFAIDGAGAGVQVQRWTGEILEDALRLPALAAEGRLTTDTPFLGPDGRWWAIDIHDDAFAYDGRRWAALGALPINGLSAKALPPDHVYAPVEAQLWRWSPAGFALAASGVRAALGTPQGVVTWDGRELRRGGEVLLADASLSVSELYLDGCGRIWLVGREVVALEGGRAIRIAHPLLEPWGRWGFGDGTPAGVVLSDLRLVVEVARPCPAGEP